MIRFTMLSLLLLVPHASGCGQTDPDERAAAAPAKPASLAPTSAPAAAEPLSIPNGRDVEGALVGGQPSDAALAAAAREGYKTIINMRAEGEPGVAEERARVEALGMKYVWLPIAGSDSLTAETARAFDAALAEAEGKVMVHCASGNRIGAIYALREHFVRGAAPEDAIAFGQRAGLSRLEPVVKQILGAP